MMVSMEEMRAKKEGRVTPKSLITNLLEIIERGEIESVAFVAVNKEGMIETGWSDIGSVEVIGMLSIGQSQIYNMMRVDE